VVVSMDPRSLGWSGPVLDECELVVVTPPRRGGAGHTEPFPVEVALVGVPRLRRRGRERVSRRDQPAALPEAQHPRRRLGGVPELPAELLPEVARGPADL